MASWEDRFISHLEAIDKLVEDAAKAEPEAAEDLKNLWGSLDHDLTELQQVFIDIDEGNYGE